MAKYGKNNYFDGVILPEPKEEMLRRMAKGVNCTKGYLQSLDAGLLFEGSRTLECFFTYVPSDKMQIIAAFGSSMMEISVVSSEIRFYCGGAYKSTVVVPGNNYLVDIAYDGTTAICYLNGAEAARFPVTGYKVTDMFRTGSNTYIPPRLDRILPPLQLRYFRERSSRALQQRRSCRVCGTVSR